MPPIDLSVIRQLVGHHDDLPDREFVISLARDLISHSVPVLEDDRKTLADAHEDVLTLSLLSPVRLFYPGVHREGFSNGHVDIYVKKGIAHRLVAVGEAKIIDERRSYPWYRDGLTKLVDKYNSGRADITLMVCFCRQRQMYKRMAEFQQKIGENREAYFLEHVDTSFVGLGDLKGVFVTVHESNGSRLYVIHLWVNQHYETDPDTQARARTDSERRKREDPDS